MNAGREMDATVAEKVMGWRWTSPLGFEQTRHPYPPGLPPQANIFGVYEIPKYSTDITAAWEVVEKMREKGFEVSLVGNPDYPYQCRFFDGSGEMGTARGETAPLVISLAALKAVGAL